MLNPTTPWSTNINWSPVKSSGAETELMRPRIVLHLRLLCSASVVLAVGLPLMAQARDRYVVTARPIDVGVASQGLCVAVDPLDGQGVWWWEPGRSGCSNRSTGPGIFKAEHAQVARPAPSGEIDVSFRIQLHSTTSPFADVRLVLDGGRLRAVVPGVQVATESRKDLDIPESR